MASNVIHSSPPAHCYGSICGSCQSTPCRRPVDHALRSPGRLVYVSLVDSIHRCEVSVSALSI